MNEKKALTKHRSIDPHVWGLTQIVTANLAAKFDWLSVGIGALVALWAVAGLAILGGQALLRVVPLRYIVRHWRC